MSFASTMKAKDGAKPSSSGVRDKRYLVPILSVDLFERVYETNLWNFSQLIIRDYDGPLVAGTEFTGCFTFENRQRFGLFEGRIAKQDKKKGIIGIEMLQLSKEGHAFLEFMSGLKHEDNPDKNPVMKLSITHRTINWSLTGMLVDHYYGDLKSNDTFRGMIRTDKGQQAGVFAAQVVRNNQERRTLAMKFTSLSNETFELLEDAIKKNAQSHMVTG